LGGAAARSLRSTDLARLVRSVCDDQRRFPLQIATVLSQQFAGHGLQFFKVNKTVTHVCVARPHYLDMTATPVSEGVKLIVNYINTNPKCTRRQLVEALAPSPAPPPAEASAGATPPASRADSTEPTPEQTVVIADLHWLIHQGHVIEFANGMLETAKKPLPKPPKPEPAPAAVPTEPVPPAEAPTPEHAAASEPTPEPPTAPVVESPLPESAPTAAEAPAAAAVAAPEASAGATPPASPDESAAEPSSVPVAPPS
jgi:hypothetical protein